MINLTIFNQHSLLEASRKFFEALNINLKESADEGMDPDFILNNTFNDKKESFQMMSTVYAIGLVDNKIIENGETEAEIEVVKESGEKYDGILLFGVELDKRSNNKGPSRGHLSEITRAFNREYNYTPVIVIFEYYLNDEKHIALANTIREEYSQEWREGEKVASVSVLKDIKCHKTHAADSRIIDGMKINTNRNNRVDNLQQLNRYWADVFSHSKLNERFYDEISAWYYYAVSTIKLPKKPSYIKSESEHVKNFTVRLISRLIFSWFLKEKDELIDRNLLELFDYKGSIKPIFGNEEDKDFMSGSSYYKAILQNVFFNALNEPIEAKRNKNYIFKDRLPENFDFSLFDDIPFLNGGLFDKLDEDNCDDRTDDNAFFIPNELFYADELEVKVQSKTVKTKGINRILASYKFTVEENTSDDEEIALDPELLGLVFENLLAELDPVEAVAKTARRESGSYYTPRKVISYMANESLMLYLKRSSYLESFDDEVLRNLVYYNNCPDDHGFKTAVINAIDEIKVLDPACGSGAFPMGMLQRMVEIIHIVDENNILWIEKALQHIPPELHHTMREDFKKHDLNYARKLGLIRNAIYGVDIQPLAVMISKLRFFISLLAEQKIDKSDKEHNYHISPFPNLETKIICADTLQNVSAQKDAFFDLTIQELAESRNNYYKPEVTYAEKELIVEEIAVKLNELFPYEVFGKKVSGLDQKDKLSAQKANIGWLKKWFKNAAMAAPFFNENAFFPELNGNGFDIVIGNPPYGGTKISNELKSQLGLESKDPYGAFISRFMGQEQRPTPLKANGVLSFIVSDTFMTIKSHKKLRNQLIKHPVHKMIRVHPDTFKATVNTAIIVIEKNKLTGDKNKKYVLDDSHQCLMADLTRINIHENYHRFLELLYKTAGEKETTPESGIHYMKGDDWTSQSSPEYAIYTYPQNLIKRNSNLPFFVASPKLFRLMWGDDFVEKKEVKIDGEQVNARLIEMNGKDIPVVKLGDIAEVKVGLQTGDNEAYLFQKPEARGSYRNINDYREFLLTEKDLEKIRSNEQLRLSVIENGISKDDPKSERYFGGRYIIPHDKGGESDSATGWLPNYWVPTSYFIDWSEWAINRILSHKDKNGKLKSRFQNITYYFKRGIDYSQTGVYAPTFRLNSGANFNTEATSIFSLGDLKELLGCLVSKQNKFEIKNFIDNTVHASADKLKETVISIESFSNEIKSEVQKIIDKQETNPRYDYLSHEQLEIDRLVYEAYGLNDEDIWEVENWYERRYPKLVEAQKRNLRKLGKPDDYVEIYQRIRDGEDLVS